MENNLKFNSAICTSRVQSERLLALGLKKETADMFYAYYKDRIGYDWYLVPNPATLGDKRSIPAWSLHRLLMMTTNKRKVMLIRCESDLYDVVIKKIECEIKEGIFNKEYLEE